MGGRLGGSSPSWSYTACPPTQPTVLLQVPHTPGVPRKGSGRESTGLGAVRPGHASLRLHRRPRRSLGPPGPGPSAHTRRLLRLQRRRWGSCAPSASREHKQGEEAGVSAWAPCQRAGAGTQCPERAGERAGNENSLTQQLGKWVCSLTRLTALAACGQLRPTLGGSFQREGRAHCRLLGSRPCLPLARDLHVAGWRIPLPSRPFTKASNSPQPEQSGLYPLRRCILFTRPGRCGGAYGCWIHVTFPPNLTTLEGL